MAYLFMHGARSLGICGKMGRLLTERHGVPAHRVEVVHNYVSMTQPRARRTPPGETRLLRYFGGIERDMGLSTLLSCAQQVEAMASSQGSPWRFEIYTTAHGREREGPKFAMFMHTSVLPQLDDDEAYFTALAESDANLICYNFDADSVRYVQYSLANKLPDLLSVESPFLAVGHGDVGTMGLLTDHRYPLMSTAQDFDLQSLLAQISSPNAETSAAFDTARSRLRETFAETQQRVRFQALLRRDAEAAPCIALPPIDALKALIAHGGEHWSAALRDEVQMLLALTRLPRVINQQWQQRVRLHGLDWSVRDEFKNLKDHVRSPRHVAESAPDMQSRCIAMLVCSLAAERFEPINVHTRDWLLSLVPNS
jgi:hypothetical protein